jgi:hypothetical protein
LYSAGAGAAIALAALLGKKPGVRRQAVAFGLAALVVFQSAQFVIARDPLHTDAFRLTDQANQALFAPRQGTAVFVNTPELYTYRDREFPLGWYGVLVAPWHNRLGVATNLRADNAAWVVDPAQARQVQDQARLSLDFHGQVLPPDQLQTLIVSATQVARVEALRGDLHLFDIGAIQHHTPRPVSAIAEWDDAVQLVTATIESEAGIPVLSLDWWMGSSIEPDVTVFVHVQDAAGQVVAQADGDLIGGYVPIGAWQNTDRVRERRPLLMPDNLPGGTYTVIIGLYHRATQQRLAPAQISLPVNDNAISVGKFDRP